MVELIMVIGKGQLMVELDGYIKFQSMVSEWLVESMVSSNDG